MTDIVTRLRTWVHSVDAVPASDLMDEAADEIAILRADNSRRANLEQGLRDVIVRLSENGDCPDRDNAANRTPSPPRSARRSKFVSLITPTTIWTPRVGRSPPRYAACWNGLEVSDD